MCVRVCARACVYAGCACSLMQSTYIPYLGTHLHVQMTATLSQCRTVSRISSGDPNSTRFPLSNSGPGTPTCWSSPSLPFLAGSIG